MTGICSIIIRAWCDIWRYWELQVVDAPQRWIGWTDMGPGR